MRYVKWIFVVLLISSLTSFIHRDAPLSGLKVGDVAPNFKLNSMSDSAKAKSLRDLRGKYVLVSFWASYDASSRLSNSLLSHELKKNHISKDIIEMVSVSFDEYESVFKESIRKDKIKADYCFLETESESSELFNDYKLEQGMMNYLLDIDGVILAKNISTRELLSYFN